MRPCIAIDWLTVHVKMPYRDFERVKSGFTIEKQLYQTRHFKSVYVIKKGMEDVATLVSEPHSEILSFDSGLLKVHNKFLYQSELKKYVEDLMKVLCLEFRSISRVDIAMDFLKFKNNLKPENFISNYLSKKYAKTGKCRGTVTFKNAKTITFETLKFGSETSDITYYLYNKTKEMNDVKMKGWIADNWTANGWDGKQDVWRLEFSLKTSGADVIGEGGELLFSFKNIDVLSNAESVYKFYFDKHFQFVHKANKSRKDRMKPVELFTGDWKCNAIKINLSDKKEASRSDKIFAKKLMTLNQELRGHDFEMSIFTNELLSKFVYGRGITEWAKKKIPGFTHTPHQAGLHQGIILANGRNEDYQAAMMLRGMLPGAYSPLIRRRKNI